MRKKPYFGYASLLVLACTAAAVLLFLTWDGSSYTEPSPDSIDIIVDGLAPLFYAGIAAVVGVLMSTAFSVISLLRGESRPPALIGLLLCAPCLLIMVYFGLAIMTTG